MGRYLFSFSVPDSAVELRLLYADRGDLKVFVFDDRKNKTIPYIFNDSIGSYQKQASTKEC